MKNKEERINKLKIRFLKDGYVNKRNSCISLKISMVTLARYIKYLRNCGFKIKSNNEQYVLIGKDFNCKDYRFSKSNYISFKILMYIINNSPCSRKKIKNFFCVNVGEQPSNGKMTVRNLDIYINNLIRLNLTKKTYEGNEIYYSNSKKLMPIHYISFQDYVKIINCFNLSKMLFPYKNQVDLIISKLKCSIVNCSRNQLFDVDDLKLIDKIISVGINNSSQCTQEIIYILNKYCKQNALIKINLKNTVINAFALSTVFDWEKGQWYLVFKKEKTKEGFELLKVSNIKNVEFISINTDLNVKEFNRERDYAIKKINQNFGMGLDKKVEVKVIFLNHFNVIKKSKLRLKEMTGKGYELKDGSYLFCGEIQGVMDFMAWLRRFGSSAIIVSPEWLRQKHINSAYKVLDNYGVEYEQIAD